MSTYRNRPVFTWAIDWAALPTSRLEYDLREVAVGFGPEAYYGEQRHLIHGWRFTVWADGEDEVRALEDFLDSVSGRLVGFWLPTPAAAFRIVSGVSATQFDIGACGLPDTWQDHPSGGYLWFTKDGHDPKGTAITAVEANGNGTERVTVEETVSVDATWQAWVLAYVRLTDDTERGEFAAEGRFTLQLQVVELPEEYAALETGLQPVFFYRFWTDAGSEWHLTSFAWDLAGEDAVNGIDYTALRISHGAIQRTTRNTGHEVTVEAELVDGNPLTLICPPVLSQRLYVEILTSDYADIANQVVLFGGMVLGGDVQGRVIRAKCASWIDAGKAMCPAMMFQRRCNYRVYQPDTCRVVQADFQDEATIVAISGRAVTLATTGAGTPGIDTHFVTYASLGSLRNDLTGHVGCKFTTASEITLTHLGRHKVAGNTGTHTLRLVADSDKSVVASVTLDSSAGTDGQMQYAGLASPVTLPAGAAYYLVSSETTGGDQWHDAAGTTAVPDSAIASLTNGYSLNLSTFYSGTSPIAYVPVGFRHYVAAVPGRDPYAENWFAEGWLEVGSGDRLERRTILASSAEAEGSITVTLNQPLVWAIEDDTVTLLPGCDGRATTCALKFANFANFGGHSFATRNLTLKALEVPAISGGKK